MLLGVQTIIHYLFLAFRDQRLKKNYPIIYQPQQQRWQRLGSGACLVVSCKCIITTLWSCLFAAFVDGPGTAADATCPAAWRHHAIASTCSRHRLHASHDDVTNSSRCHVANTAAAANGNAANADDGHAATGARAWMVGLRDWQQLMSSPRVVHVCTCIYS